MSLKGFGDGGYAKKATGKLVAFLLEKTLDNLCRFARIDLVTFQKKTDVVKFTNPHSLVQETLAFYYVFC